MASIFNTIGIAIFLILTSCSKASLFEECCVSEIIEGRIDKKVEWNQCEDPQNPIQGMVDTLLQIPLTSDTAVQIALLNNPTIQAAFEEVGIAHADVVQAGLLQNPLIFGMVRFPDQKHACIDVEVSIAQNILDLFLIPFRQKIAEAEFQQAQLKAANAILDLAFDVEETFYSFLAEKIQLENTLQLVAAAEASMLLARGQLQQGNINDLDYQSRLNAFLETRIELSILQRNLIRLREQMNQLLGLSTSDLCWNIDPNFPPLPIADDSVECLEQIALNQRLDLEAARWEIERFARMYGITQWWAYTNAIAGLSGERDADCIGVLGPTLAFELPLFNYGQADRQRLSAQFRQSLDRLIKMEIHVLAQVRSARDQLSTNRRLASTFMNEILPLQHNIVETSQSYYHSQALSVYKLLDAKRQELQMKNHYIRSLRDYWLSKVALKRALGGNFQGIVATADFCCPDTMEALE